MSKYCTVLYLVLIDTFSVIGQLLQHFGNVQDREQYSFYDRSKQGHFSGRTANYDHKSHCTGTISSITAFIGRVPFDQKFWFEFPIFSYVGWNGFFHQAGPISFYSHLGTFPAKIMMKWLSAASCKEI